MLKIREFAYNRTSEGFHFELDSSYVFIGKRDGLYEFEDGGKREFFMRSKNAPASWHLRRGAYFYEFVRSV